MPGKALLRWAACAALLMSAGCCEWAEHHCSTCHPAQAAAYVQAPVCCCQPVPACGCASYAPAPAPVGCAPVPPPAGTWAAPR
jgi:hypothetical protein